MDGIRKIRVALTLLGALGLGGCMYTIEIVPEPPPKDYGPYVESKHIEGFGKFSDSGLGFSADRKNGIIEFFLTKANTGVTQRYYDYGNFAAHYDKAVWHFPSENSDIGEARSDYNKDNLEDFLRLVPEDESIVLYRNIGNNQYSPYDQKGHIQELVRISPISQDSPTALAVDDWNGDGNDEFAIVSLPELSSNGIIISPSFLNVMIYKDGNWSPILKIQRDKPLTWLGLAAVDYDGDGDVDLIAKFADEAFARVYLNSDF